MYLAGKDKQLANNLGGDDGFMEKVSKYFGRTMMEARRLLEPEVVANEEDDSPSEESSDDP